MRMKKLSMFAICMAFATPVHAQGFGCGAAVEYMKNELYWCGVMETSCDGAEIRQLIWEEALASEHVLELGGCNRPSPPTDF